MISTWRGVETGVMDLLRLFRWRWMHQLPSPTKKGWRTALEGDPGFPDIVACRRGRLLFIEVKSGKATLSVAQRAWRQEILLVGAEYYLWGPLDLQNGIVEKVLR